MTIIELLLIAVALAMDAFAISICAGLTLQPVNAKNAAIVGLYFGGFQAGMPLIGYLAGTQFADKITAFDHWVAFAVLAIIGGKMVLDSRGQADESGIKSPNVKTMLPLAIATSIDALAVGVSFAFMQVSIAPAVSAIGVVTFSLSVVGVLVGKIAGLKFKSRAELVGGIILVAMGIKILVEHLFFG